MQRQVQFIFACFTEGLQLHAAIICHIQFTTPGLALGSKVKFHYTIEHDVSIIITFPRIAGIAYNVM